MKYLIVLLPLFLCQCGYNWGHATRKLPGGHKTVYVDLFDNPSKEVGLEVVFSQALARELQRSGFAIVTDKHRAELIIKGTILTAGISGAGSSLNFVAKDYSSADVTQRTSTDYQADFFVTYIFKTSVNIRAERSRDKHVVWQTNLIGQKSYLSSRLRHQGVRSSNVLYNQARKKETIKLVAQEMMSDAFDRMTESF